MRRKWVEVPMPAHPIAVTVGFTIQRPAYIAGFRRERLDESAYTGEEKLDRHHFIE